MSDFYCRNCTTCAGWVNTSSLPNPTGTPYQLEKYIKHTRPTANYPINSVINDASTYSDCMASALASSCVEIDQYGRINLILDAGTGIGGTYRNGVFERSDDAIKVVLPFNSQERHWAPTATKEMASARCAACGGPLT